MRRAAKRDAIEPEVRMVLRCYGVVTWQLSGDGLPDILGYHLATRRWQPFEVKSGKRGRITSAQQRQFDKGAQWPVIRSVEAAVALFIA